MLELITKRCRWSPEGPEGIARRQEESDERRKATIQGDSAALQTPRRADAEQLSHQQTQIERADVDQEALEDVVVTAQMHASHPAGFVQMRARALQPFPTQAQQAFAALAANATAVPIDRVPRLGLFLPAAAPALGLGDVAPHAYCFEIDELLVAVIPLVADD